MTRLALVPRRERQPGSSRYELLVKIASGATATVYVARLTGAAGEAFSFSRLVAVKRAHPHLVDDPVSRKTLLAEARVASRIHHANVAAVHDVDETDDDLLLVMDYVEGASLAELLEASVSKGAPIPPPVAVKIALDACAGLSAVHELCDDDGRPLGLVHRDVSPQNLLVGIDGTARISDFGLAKLAPSANASRTTGAVQGKIAYVSPEYVEGASFDVRSEVFALGVVVWEAITNRRLFRGANEADTLRRVLSIPAPAISTVAPHVGKHLDMVIAKALEKGPSRRYPTVRAFGEAIERVAREHALMGTSSEVGAWVRACVGVSLEQRRALLRESVSLAGAVEASFSETVSMTGADVLSKLTPGAEGTEAGITERADTVSMLHTDVLSMLQAVPEPLRQPADPETIDPEEPSVDGDADLTVSLRSDPPPHPGVSSGPLPAPAPPPRPLALVPALEPTPLPRSSQPPAALPPPTPPPPRASLASQPSQPLPPPSMPSPPASQPSQPLPPPSASRSLVAPPSLGSHPGLAVDTPLPKGPLGVDGDAPRTGLGVDFEDAPTRPPSVPGSRLPIAITAAALAACVLMAWVKWSEPPAAPPALPPVVENTPAPQPPPAPTAVRTAEVQRTPPEIHIAVPVTALPEAPTTPPPPPARRARPPAAPPAAAVVPENDEPPSSTKPPPNPYKRKK